jgi:hypothetical protein
VFWLTDKALLVCIHEVGNVDIEATQDLVFVDGRPVLVKPNTVGRSIKGCPLVPPLLKPCVLTLPVRQGYSDLLFIDDHGSLTPVCLDAVRGFTDGHPPQTYDYKVNYPGQQCVSESP